MSVCLESRRLICPNYSLAQTDMDKIMALITIYCISGAVNIFLYYKWMLERELSREAQIEAELLQDALMERTRLLEKTIEFYTRGKSDENQVPYKDRG